MAPRRRIAPPGVRTRPLARNTTAPEKPGMWERTFNFLSQAGKLLAVLWLLLLTILIGHDFFEKWRYPSVVVRPLLVSKGLDDEGFSGQEQAEVLTEIMKEIRDNAISQVRPDAKGPSLGDHMLLNEPLLQEVKIPGTGISTELVSEALLQAVGHGPIRVTGQLNQSSTATTLTIHISGRRTEVIRVAGKACEADCLSALLHQGAEHIFRSFDPYLVALYLYGQNDLDRCEEAIRYCLTHEPASDDAEAYNLWSLILRRRGDLEGSARKLSRALDELAGERPRPQLTAAIYNNWGSLLSSQERLQEARDKYELALKADPSDAKALFNCGLAWQKEKRYSEAAARYREAIAANPNLTAAYTNLGFVLAEQGKIDAALAQITALERITNKQDTEVYLNWGYLLERQGKYDLAFDKYERALDLNPNLPPAYEGQARCYGHSGDLLSAVASVFRARRLQQQAPLGAVD